LNLGIPVRPKNKPKNPNNKSRPRTCVSLSYTNQPGTQWHPAVRTQIRYTSKERSINAPNGQKPPPAYPFYSINHNQQSCGATQNSGSPRDEAGVYGVAGTLSKPFFCLYVTGGERSQHIDIKTKICGLIRPRPAPHMSRWKKSRRRCET